MAAFAIYTYSFQHVENVGLYLGQEDEHEPLPTLKDRQDFVQKIFHDDLHGGRPFECFVTEFATDPQGKKVRNKTKYGSKVVWEHDGIILLLVSNPYCTITTHKNFKKDKTKDEPWCHVLIDNRFGREFIAIEKTTAFKDIDKVATILEESLRSRLTPHFINITIKNQYTPDAFWEIVEKHKFAGVNEVAFKFTAPNHPWASELLSTMRSAAREMNARPSATFCSQDNEHPLILEKNNEELSSYVKLCALEGEDIVIKVKGIRARLHVINVKNKFVFQSMSDELFRKMLTAAPELFDESYSSFATFLDQINTNLKPCITD